MSGARTFTDGYRRATLQRLLDQCTEAQVALFVRMYGTTEATELPDDKVDWAIKQCERTVDKNTKAGITSQRFGKNRTGKFAIFNPVPTNELEALQHGNALAAGKNSNYPLGTSGCFNVGISGGCGPDCFVYRNGDCEEHEEMIEHLDPGEKYADEWTLEQHRELYPDLP